VKQPSTTPTTGLTAVVTCTQTSTVPLETFTVPSTPPVPHWSISTHAHTACCLLESILRWYCRVLSCKWAVAQRRYEPHAMSCLPRIPPPLPARRVPPPPQVLSPVNTPATFPVADATCPPGSWLTGCSCFGYGSSDCVATVGTAATGTANTCSASSASATLAVYARCQRRDFCKVLRGTACANGGLCVNLGLVGTGYQCVCKPGYVGCVTCVTCVGMGTLGALGMWVCDVCGYGYVGYFGCVGYVGV
jgi:hypothetical protein